MSASEPKATSGPFRIEVDRIPGPDFTIYKTRHEFQDLLNKHYPELKDEGKHSYALSVSIEAKAGKGPPKGPIHARGLASLAYGGNLWSITVRCDEPGVSPSARPYKTLVGQAFNDYARKNEFAKKNPKPGKKMRSYLGYWPSGLSEYADAINLDDVATEPDEPTDPGDTNVTPPDKAIFLNDIHNLCVLLRDILLPESDTPPTGLIAVTGATDSSKSLITRGLIFLFLQAAASRALVTMKRKPHLITFEDPIEQYYIKNPATHIEPELAELENLLTGLNIDYTPREKYLDASTLKEVLKDALRQTPALLFVGETREEEDWRELLEFAGSGHLVITTSHAGSVVEAMSRIFRDTKTQTAAQRSEISRRILGIINIRSFTPTTQAALPREPLGSDSRPAQIRALLPAVWKRTSRSMNNLIADGLASLVPELSPRNEHHKIGYYSRTYFAHELTADRLNPELKERKDELHTMLVQQARRWDLEGA